MKKIFPIRNSDAATVLLTPALRLPSSVLRPPSSGFTLIEMLVVVLIISILMSVGIGAFSQARNTVWKERTRDTARQIAHAWNSRLMDDHAFPTGLGNGDFQTTAANMMILTNNDTAQIHHAYLEQSADQLAHGVKDHWGNYFNVRLDWAYTGKIQNPVDNTDIHASVLVWSLGPSPGSPQKSWIMIWQ